MSKKMVAIDGNWAAAHVAYAFSEVAAIYPITPSSNMGEYVDEWAAKGQKNLFGQELKVAEMQSEAGAAGAVHGALSAGAMSTTFTASQGLLLMIPNMYKIAGEMQPTVFHVSARSLAAQSLSIFGDHSDVMSVRMTGWAMLAATSIQDTMDLALVSHLATLDAKIPFLNFFDGFRTSHEIQKVEEISYETMKTLVNEQHVQDFRDTALKPEKPFLKSAAQNPDVYFQGRETTNKFYDAIPELVQGYMNKVAAVTGRPLNLFEYYGAEDAEKIIVVMASGADTVQETVDYMNANGEKVGMINIRLFRPFSIKHLKEALPASVKKIAVLDRTKEPGNIGEPLYMDVKVALEDKDLFIIGGRYGLSSKEFTPSMVKAIYTHLDKDGHHGFTVGINDDVTNLSIPVTENVVTENEDCVRCKFWGLGSDGTVSANKNSIKIIAENTDMFAQGYFSYDSKKSGGITISHLRFGQSKIKSPYLIVDPSFVACHNPSYIGRYDLLEGIQEGGTFLLNSEFSMEDAFSHLTKSMQETIISKKIKFYNIDALKIAHKVGLGGRISTVMMAAFFKISGVLEETKAIDLMKEALKKTFIKKGQEIVDMNWKCVDLTSAQLVEVKVPASIDKSAAELVLIKDDAIDFAKTVVEPIMRLKGDDIPVSAMPLDGKFPSSLTKLEKRAISSEVPCWISDNCIQCNQCALVCPHAAIRPKQIAVEDLKGAPATFNTIDVKKSDLKYRLQVYAEDCTGCGSCIETCIAKTKAIQFSPIEKELEAGAVANATFFDALPANTDGQKESTIKGVQLKTPLFEFSGACAGCGETPYVKLATQLFGERMVIANATGCSSIYGGTFPSSPYTTNPEGKGPAWANSLFEDNAEYGYGMRLAINKNREQLSWNLDKLVTLGVSDELKNAWGKSKALWEKTDKESQDSAKVLASAVNSALASASGELKAVLEKTKELIDYLVDKSVWIFGGDGWAYDIGFGGLDHVVAMGENVNILVLDTEVYSNTGGQASKATPIGAVAKFAAKGMELPKKDLGLMCMSYGYVYVASVNMGANKNQVLKAFQEAEAYDGPSVIIAYSPCIAHGIDLKYAQSEEKKAVDAGYWPIYRYNPLSAAAGENPFKWETKEISGSYQDFIRGEKRYSSLLGFNKDHAETLFGKAEKDAERRLSVLKKLAD